MQEIDFLELSRQKNRMTSHSIFLSFHIKSYIVIEEIDKTYIFI